MERSETVIPEIVHRGYEITTDELTFKFADGSWRCLDAVQRGAQSNHHPNPSPDYIYLHGRNPLT